MQRTTGCKLYEGIGIAQVAREDVVSSDDEEGIALDRLLHSQRHLKVLGLRRRQGRVLLVGFLWR